MPYVSPVQCLCGLCVGVFENANQALPPILRQAVIKGRVNANIDLNCVPGPLKTPYVTGNPATMSLHIVHLEMLWAFTYGMFVAYEHQMRDAMVHQGLQPLEPTYSKTVLRRAGNLLRWSKGLRTSHTSWPTDAPSPASYLPEEKMLTEKVNTIFLTAVAVMMHHELCHAAQGHMAAGPTPQEALEQEKEADDFAHHQFLNGFSEEYRRRILGWSMLVPWLSDLYVIDGPRALFQATHPHVHHRITHALERLNFSNDENRDYFYGLCLCTVTTYMVENGLLNQNFQDNPELKLRFERASDAFEYFLDQIDALKDGN